MCPGMLYSRLPVFELSAPYFQIPCYFLSIFVLLFGKFRVTFFRNITRNLRKYNTGFDNAVLIV